MNFLKKIKNNSDISYRNSIKYIRRRDLRRSVFFSILLHILILFVWGLLRHQQRNSNSSKTLTWIEIDSSVESKNKEEETKTKRIVQTSLGERVNVPEKNSFLGWQNQIVRRETAGKKISSPAPSKRSSMESKPVPLKLSKLGVSILPRTERNSPDSHEWATPGTRPEDYIHGITESNQTALNTKEYLFYGYFQRIRERLDRAWVPLLRTKLIAYYNAGRQLQSDMDHITRILVVLNQSGEIVRVQMVSQSGTSELDDAAIAAFNKAGPFPNPPKGIVDMNQEIKIPWDFILKT